MQRCKILGTIPAVCGEHAAMAHGAERSV